MPDYETNKAKLAQLRLIAVIAMLVSLGSYFLPIFSSTAIYFFLGHEEVNGIQLFLGCIKYGVHDTTILLAVTMIYFVPLLIHLISGITLWAFYYKLCMILSFVGGAIRIVLTVLIYWEAAAAPAIGWWIGMIGMFVCGIACRSILNHQDSANT